jgi:imidazolonepropionase-like amidohydrolase
VPGECRVRSGLGGDAGRIPGIAEHHERELIVEAGLTSMQAITAAAGENAKVHSADRGTIVAGRRADLRILDADPLADIRHTQKSFAVYHDRRSVVDLPGR